MSSLARLIFRHARIITALLGVAALGLTAATTLGSTSFTAQVGGTGSFQSGTLLLSKTNGSGTCLSSSNSAGSIATNINSSCAGSDLNTGTNNVIGVSSNQTITLTNQGSVNSSSGLTLTTGACTGVAAPYASSTLDPLASGSDTAGFCGDVWVTVENETGTVSCLYPAQAGSCPALSSSNTLAGLASTTKTLAATLAAGSSEQIKVTTELGTAATNADQGLSASMPMTYTLNQ